MIQFFHPQQRNIEAHTSTLKAIGGFTSFPRSLESTIIVKVASNVQQYNHAPLVLPVNNYWLIVLVCTPKIHMIPSHNPNDPNESIPCLPFSTTQSLRKSNHPFHVVTHIQSSPASPILGDTTLGKGFLALEGQMTKEYTCLKTIIPIIACSWK